MTDSFEISTLLDAPPEVVCRAWMDSAEHAAFIDGHAEIDPRVEGEYRIWDGYITGKTTEMDAPRRVVQSWRTTDFPEGSPDSILEVLFESAPEGTRLTLRQSNIPVGQGPMYEKGWQEHYFEKMRAYFSRGS